MTCNVQVQLLCVRRKKRQKQHCPLAMVATPLVDQQAMAPGSRRLHPFPLIG